MTDEKDARLTRQLIREELDASNSYEEKAQATSDPEAAEVYRDISREEKVHAGELQALLDREDPESTEAMREGIEETGLEGSFKDLFDRKREDYIHKSMFGVHIEKKGNRRARENSYLRTQLKAENDAKNNAVETGGGATPQEGGTHILNLISPELREQLEQIYYDALPDREKKARDYNAKRIKQIEEARSKGLNIGSHKDLVNSYPKVEGPRHLYRPRGKMKIREDELDKFVEGGPERRDEAVSGDVESGQDLSDADKLAQIAQNQGAGEQDDGSVRGVYTSEFERQGKPVGLRNDTQRNLSWGNDYDEIFDPDQIGETEVERFVNDQGDEPEADAPSSDKRPWLTWRYFGNHLLQATTITDEDRDWAGNARTHFVRVPKGDGTFDTKEVYTTRIVMNYRISRPGKDIQYEGEPFKMICYWDPTAFNPITRRNTGAFMPEKVMTPGGTVIYDKDDPERFQDPWDALEAEMSKQALYNGVVEYLTNPDYKAKVDAQPAGGPVDQDMIDQVMSMFKDTKYADQLGVRSGNLAQAQQLLDKMTPTVWGSIISKVSAQYKDLNEEFARAREKAARNKSQMDALIDSVVSESVSRHLNDWLRRNNVMGFDDNSDVTAEDLYRHYDSISGMFRFNIRGEKVEWPLEKMEAWMDHAEKYYERQARYEYNETLAEEQKVQDAFDKRENIENAAIEDYLYKSLVAEAMAMGEGRLDEFGHKALHAEANRLTQEMLYGDGTVFNEFLKNMGVLEGDVDDPRSFLLNKAGFNWDVFEHNRKWAELSADLAHAAEVSSMKDPRFHDRVKDDLEKAFVKRKMGIKGAFAVAQANKAMAKERMNNPEWAWEHALQSFLNRKVGGVRGALYGGGGVMTARYKDLQNSDADVMNTLNNFVQGGDSDAILGEQAPLAIGRAIENVMEALKNPDFNKEIKSKQFQRENGPKAINALLQALSDPETLKQEVLSGSDEGNFLLRTLMNFNGMARAMGFYKERGLTGKEGGKINLKRARKDLGRMFNSALVPGGSRDQFATTMRNLARAEVERILDGSSDDPALQGEGEEAVWKAYEATMDKLVKDAALRSAQLNIEEIHKIDKPKRPRYDDPDYDRNYRIYERQKKKYYSEVKARTEEIYAEANRLLSDPEYVQKTREAMDTLAKRTTINTLVADRGLRQIFTRAMGNSDRIMSLTGFPTMGEELMWESDNERTSLDNMPELSDDDRLEKRIEGHKGPLGLTRDELRDTLYDALVSRKLPDRDTLVKLRDKILASKDQDMWDAWIDMINRCERHIRNHIDGEISPIAFEWIMEWSRFLDFAYTPFQALVQSYQDQGFPLAQAEERARQFAKINKGAMVTVPERGSAGAMVGEYRADDITLPDRLSEADSMKIIKDALWAYFKKHYVKAGRVSDVPDEETGLSDIDRLKMGGKDMMMTAYKYLAKEGLVKPLKQDPAHPDKITGYMIDRGAFSGRDFDNIVYDPNSENPEERMSEMGETRVTRHENARAAARNVLTEYLQGVASPGLIQRLYPRLESSSRARGVEKYEATLDKLLRNKLTEKRALQLRMEGMNPRKAGRLAKKQVLNDFDFRMTSENLAEQGTPFAKLLEDYGLTPKDIQGLKVEAMRTSGAPYYEQFIKPFFERAGREVGANTADEELKLFEQLNSGDPEAQNRPEFKEYWQKFMDTPGKLNPDQIGALVSGIEAISRKRGDKIEVAQRVQDGVMNRVYGEDSTLVGRTYFENALRDLARNEANGDPDRYNELYVGMLTGQISVDTDGFRHLLGNKIRRHAEISPDEISDPVAFERELFTRIVNNPGNPVNFTGLENIQSSVRDKARKKKEKEEADAKAAEDEKALYDQDVAKYTDMLEDVYGVRRFMTSPDAYKTYYAIAKEKGQDAADEWAHEEAERERKRYKTAIVAQYGKDVRSFGVEEANRRRKAREYALSDYMANSTIEDWRRAVYGGRSLAAGASAKRTEAKRQADDLEKTKAELEARNKDLESMKEAHKKKSEEQGEPQTPEELQGVKSLERAPVIDISSILQDAIKIGANAAPGTPEEKMAEVPTMELGSTVVSPTKDYKEANNKVRSMNEDRGGGATTHEDVSETKYKVTPEAQSEYDRNLVLANKQLAGNSGKGSDDNGSDDGKAEDGDKFQASAFDTPFADILSSKRTQTIRKNETGTVISTDTLSTPMTEQTDTPQEQNSVEAGGFADLMKSKMASTHMMEEPSEEREDWIPMRNGYRRVTIGSGKDCVHSMMRNPPRSANAPGTRTRKV